MPVRFRPFGVLGSTLEVVVGLLALKSVLWTDEDYSGGFTAVLVCLGVLLMGAGTIGLTAAIRGGYVARKTRS